MSGGVASLGVRNWWALGMGTALLTSCMSPTLPMPPPSRPEISGPDASGVVVLRGYAPPESWVTAYNMSTDLSYGSRADANNGAYRLSILASIGDTIQLNYRLDMEDSDAVVFAIPTFAAYPRGTGGTAGMGAIAGAAGMAGAWMGATGGSTGAYAGQAGTAGSPQ
jgi:hypothetical protein